MSDRRETCLICGKTLTKIQKKKKQQTCSRLCGHTLAGLKRRIDKTQCPVCKKMYWGHTKYCSKQCALISRRQPEKECPVCGKLFWSKTQIRQTCCSRKCAGIYKRTTKTIPCKVCGKPFKQKATHLKHCSKKCALISCHRSTKKLKDIQCGCCGKTFSPKSEKTRFCSRECWIVAGPKRGKTIYKRSCSVCGRKFSTYDKRQIACSWACGVKLKHIPDCQIRCRACGKWFTVGYASFKRAKFCPDCRFNGSKKSRRRAKKYGVRSSPYNRIEVFNRDGWVCGICGEPVDPAIKYPDPMSASIDHTVEMVRGGDDIFSNVQCSHLICNLRKKPIAA